MAETENSTVSITEKYRLRKEEKRQKKLKRRKIALICCAVFFVLFIIFLSVGKTTAYYGVSVAGVPVHGKTQKQIEKLLQEEFDFVPEISVSVGDITVEFPFEQIATYDLKKTAKTAFNKGKSNWFESVFTFVTPFVKRDVPIYVIVNEKKIADELKKVQAEVPGGYVETTYEAGETEIIILTGHGGNAMDIPAICETIKQKLYSFKDAHIDATLVKKEFEVPSAEMFMAELRSEPQDAYYDAEMRKIVPHIFGYKLDAAEIEKVLQNAKPDRKYKINVQSVEPKITTETLEKQMFGDTLGTYTTQYNAWQTDRSHNVELATSKLNGVIAEPGDVISYNEIVGPRTAEAGFRNAAVYTSEGVADDIGGGVCQPSTTLYNAALYANLEIVYRSSHAYPVSYAEKGQDATVVMGQIDFKFKNNTKHPILIKANAGGGYCSISIYGKKDKPFKVEIYNILLNTVPYETVYIDDPELEPGKEVVERSGITGYVVETYRKVTIDGKTTEERMPSSTYRTLSEKIRRGPQTEEAQDETQEDVTEEVMPTQQPENTEAVPQV